MKLPSSGSANQSTAESELDEPDSGKVKTSKSQQFAERLKRFRSVENVNKQTEDEAEEKKSSDPRLQKLTVKLQDWKKSFKKKPPSDTHNTDDDDDDEVNSPQKRDKPSGILMKRLQYIRNRKHHSTDDPDDDEEGGTSYRESFKSRAKLQLEKGVAAAQHVPQMTIDKFKESKKYFRKKQDKDKYKETESKTPKIPERDSGESALEESDEEPHAKPNRKYGEQASRNQDTAKHALTKHYYSSDDEDDEEGADAVEATKVTLEPYEQNVLVPLTRATWTAKPILSDSDGEEDDDILPRVLIHQDNSDVFESTLIIAVTRPIVTRSHTNSPYITELPADYEDSPKASSTDSAKPSSPETKADNWKPNRESISNFTIGSPDMEGKLSKHDSLQSFSSRSQHSRKHSMDSSSEDSWIKDVPRDLSTAIGLNNLTEVEEPWRIKMDNEPQEKLYKAKSIDIFEIHQTHGEDLHIFEDFDDELRNTPIVSIEKDEDMQEHQRSSNESFDQDDSSEGMECADDDNSSRITKILKQTDSEEKNDEEKPERPKITSHVYDNGQENNTLVITTIVKPPETEEKKVEKLSENPRITSPLFSNSRESLMGVPEDQNRSTDDSGDEEDNEYSSNDEKDEADDDVDRPPSKNPSPPPPVSPPPPPPPLPQRQPSLRLSKLPKSSQQTLDSTPTPFEFPKSPLQQKSSPQSPPQPSSPILFELPKSPLLQKILANAGESISMPPSEAPPALPQSKPPPIPPNRTVGFPPKIPERTPSMSKVARPLVKTASLRLAYSEQVNPEDVGKVNKLISRFEPNGRPRIVVRKPYISQDSEEYSDEEEEDDEVKPIEELESKNKKAILARIEDELNDNLVISSRNITADRTPTNKPILQKSLSIEIPDLPLIAAPMALVKRTGQQPEPQVNRGPLEDKKSSKPNRPPPPQITTSQPSPTKVAASSIANSNNVSCNTGYQTASIIDTNSNFSQPNSEYGSPMDYPSSLMGSAEVTPVTGRRDTELLNISQRSRRSMTRDEERFYSFDSDEGKFGVATFLRRSAIKNVTYLSYLAENSYYSISSTGSSRYVVEL